MENNDEEKYQSPSHRLIDFLLFNMNRLMMVDWQNKEFPNRVPDDMTYLNEKDKETLNNIMALSENSIDLFHQLGFLELYLKKTG